MYIVRLRLISRLDIKIEKLFFAISTRGRAISTLKNKAIDRYIEDSLIIEHIISYAGGIKG